MDYKYEATCMVIFIYGGDDVSFYVDPKPDSDVDVYYESLREVIKKVEIVVLKDSVYILTPKYCQKVMTIVKTDICTHHLISRFSTNVLIAQSSISYVEH